MSRLQYLAAHPKRALGTLGVLLTAAGLTAGSGAFFSDTSASNGNTVAAGTLDILVHGSADPAVDQAVECAVKTDAACADTGISTAAAGETAAFTAANFVPTAADHVVTRHFTVENKGSAPARVKLTSAISTDPVPALAGALKATIRRVGGDNAVVLNAGSVAALNTEVLIPAATTWTYAIDLNLLETGVAQNDLQGQALAFAITAAARNQTAPAA